VTGVTKRYCTLYRIGHWGSLDGECETWLDQLGLTNHSLTFHLINKYGHHIFMGSALIGETRGGDPYFFDEDGERFDSLEAAVRKHAEDLVKVVAMPGRWHARPARYETWQGTVATAFDAGV
jgi:hypothetical protein